MSMEVTDNIVDKDSRCGNLLNYRKRKVRAQDRLIFLVWCLWAAMVAAKIRYQDSKNHPPRLWGNRATSPLNDGL